MTDPRTDFHSAEYHADNRARLEHLKQVLRDMAFNADGKTVLQVGAGIGDQVQFWIDLGADVTATDPEADNIKVITGRFQSQQAYVFDVDYPETNQIEQHSVVFVYGILHQLRDPSQALRFLASKCDDLLLLETQVTFGRSEPMAGNGPRLTRSWVFEELKKSFPYVYQPSFQPLHDEFPTDWSAQGRVDLPARTTFIASRQKLWAGSLFPYVLEKQTKRDTNAQHTKAGLEGLIERTPFDLIIDVGANQGQFAKKMRRMGHKCRIASFEPLSSAFQRLADVAARDNDHIAFPFGLGATNETLDIKISGNSVSTSLLPLTAMTVDAEPMTASIGSEQVEIRRLDDIMGDVFTEERLDNVLLKLDVQGFEIAVLNGATAAIRHVTHILTECSFVPVYEGEPLIEDQITWMRERGFRPISMGLGWSNKRTGETYQVDMLFAR